MNIEKNKKQWHYHKLFVFCIAVYGAQYDLRVRSTRYAFVDSLLDGFF